MVIKENWGFRLERKSVLQFAIHASHSLHVLAQESFSLAPIFFFDEQDWLQLFGNVNFLKNPFAIRQVKNIIH